jgi:type II secretory pathway predicted ATPase ExeA
MNYLDFYSLTQEPFSNSPEGRFWFNSAQHAQATLRLQRAVGARKGLAMLTGDLGTGKTMLARKMLELLPEEEFESALMVVIHARVTADWLLQKIAMQIGVENPDGDKLRLLGQLYERLVAIHQAGRHAVVLIDEAQMLGTRELMEEFRGLLNLEHNERRLITFVFLGLPEIEEILKLDPPLAQRVDVRCRLEALNEPSTEMYVQHRLRLSGATRDLFTRGALVAIHAFSKGTPRLINTLCDNALFEGFLLKHEIVDERIVTAVAFDLGLSEATPPRVALAGGEVEGVPAAPAAALTGEQKPEGMEDEIEAIDRMLDDLESEA